MKKNLFLLMALAGAMVVMPGCSNDDDNGNGEGNGGGKDPVYKRVTGFTVEETPIEVFGQTMEKKMTQAYTYDEAGKITRMDIAKKSDMGDQSGFIQYAHAASKVDVTGKAPGSSRDMQPVEYTLSKGNASVINKKATDRDAALTESVEYDAAGYLSKITVSPGTADEQTFTFTYANGVLDKLVKFKKSNSRQDEYTFTYDKYENNGSIDLFAYLGSDWVLWAEHCDLFLLGIGGKRSAKLPVSVSCVVDWTNDEDPADPATVTNYTYQTSSDGYVLQYTNGTKDSAGSLVKYKVTYAE